MRTSQSAEASSTSVALPSKEASLSSVAKDAGITLRSTGSSNASFASCSSRT